MFGQMTLDHYVLCNGGFPPLLAYTGYDDKTDG